jgi:hypothetical protein
MIAALGLSTLFGYTGVRLNQRLNGLVFLPGAAILMIAFWVGGMPDLLSFLDFEALFALALLMLYSGALTSLFAMYYFIRKIIKR